MRWIFSFLAICLFLGGTMASAKDGDGIGTHEHWRDTMNQGNYKEAYEGFRKRALEPRTNPLEVGNDLTQGVNCLMRLNRVSEADAFREDVIRVHAENWRLLQAAAQSYLQVEHGGFMVAGEFQRGRHRGQARAVNAGDRDRVRALQLMNQARPLADVDDNKPHVAQFYFNLAQMLLNQRGHSEAWRLQALTDIDTLPDYAEGWWYGRGSTGAPVDADGNPVFHEQPKDFDSAETDGQRWRWCLAQVVEVNPSRRAEIDLHFADFHYHQFGVQTMGGYSWPQPFGRSGDGGDDGADGPPKSGTYDLHTLAENETISRLASGVRRFTLPDEFNFVRIYRDLMGNDQGGNWGRQAAHRLEGLFENRRQYPAAVAICREGLKRFPQSKSQWNSRLSQIEGNWGHFESVKTQPADGGGAAVDFRFRNARSVQFTAKEVRVEELLADIKTYLKSRPTQLDHQKTRIDQIGYRLIHQNEQKYVGREVAKWNVGLEPRENHFDRRITVPTTLRNAGAYLLTAKVEGGNTSHIVVWVADTVIAKKTLDGKSWYFVADASTGEPVPGAVLDMFGFRIEGRDLKRDGRRFDVFVKQSATKTDATGQAIVGADMMPTNYQWIITARNDQGRFAFLGYQHVWYGRQHDREYNATRVYTVTDRPVYRPEQKVHYKFWVRHAQYDKPDESQFAGRKFMVELYNPKGDRLVHEQTTADAYGGIEGDWDIPADATLGVYRVQVAHHGGGTFRIEEYKKPEFEVSIDAPTEPVMLGETITATVKADYYFGAPVAHAKVKYKVERTSYDEQWYPPAPWDWFYGEGYWWFGYDTPWHPGWWRWGCARPTPFWWPARHQPPELVAEREVEIGPDGTVKFDIDTTLAAELHGDMDHRYRITAEVTDQSRRTIVGSGQVLVARRPYKVHAWSDRGYYRAGEVMTAEFAARTPDGKPVEGTGKVRAMRVLYRDGKPVETVVFETELATDAAGKAQQRFRMRGSGQFRIAYELTDKSGHVEEGAFLTTVRGEDFQSADLRFNSLELVPDKADYAPGESVRLAINTNRVDGTVMLFVRPTNGVYLPPQVVRTDGKSKVVEIPVSMKDMPNFFVEAMTIANGELHTEVRQIVVPPEKRVLTVEVEPSKPTYRPGEKAQVVLRLKDFHGKPFTGSTVVAIYDKSLEYIAGGPNTSDIREFFWKWQRSHHPSTESTLQRAAANLMPPNTQGMGYLGVHGRGVADELALLKEDGGLGGQMLQRPMMAMNGMARGGGMGAEKMADAAMPMAAMGAAEAPGEASGMAHMAFGDAKDKMQAGGKGGGGADMVQPTVRSNFADTALWVGAIETDGDGTATVSLDMPENLTTWQIRVWGMGHGTKVGQGTAEVITRKDLIIRLQAPRFFVQKDEVVLSAVVHNYLEEAKNVRVVLATEGDTIEPLDATTLAQNVQIAPNGETRVDWRVRVTDEGEATIRMSALTDEESDAMEQTFPCYIHGMLKMDAVSGSLRPDETSGSFTLTVPAERRPEQTRLEVRYSPTLAGAMVDAIPYLAEYPYGCTEQTLNRFLPSVITQKVLLEMRLDLDDIRKKRTNLNAQEIGDPDERAKQWKRWNRNPVFDEAEVGRMVREGVSRLADMQLSDGGWGWFSGWGEHSTPHLTATVVHGLQQAQANDVALPDGMLQRGVAWLTRHQDWQIKRLGYDEKNPKARPEKLHADNLDALVYMVLVDAKVTNNAMRDYLYRDRTHLSVYSLAMYGLALFNQDEQEKLTMVLRNIEQFLEENEENQTAWLNLPGGYWWYWHGSEFEAHAYYLKLLSRTDPKGERARRLVKYLLNNRKHATYWNSTRDTSLCVEAMADFLRASGEMAPEMTVDVLVDGERRQTVEITSANLFRFNGTLVIEGDALEAGPHKIELRKRGTGPLYYNAYLTNFTLEDYITKAGLEVKVQRKYYRLTRVDATEQVAGSRGQAIDQKVEKYQREELPNLATVTSGDLVEIELEIDSANDYEYLIFEDMKPAGFEPVDIRSGYTGNEMGAYVEFRDNRVVFFVNRLMRGKHSVSYRMRAEIPGRFSALPTRAAAMYAPELKANSDELKLKVIDE